jgi:predicted phosphodiesterase
MLKQCQDLTKMKTKIAVISDIHANADALMVALKSIKKKNVDMVVCLGDILTYGCQPLEVIDILTEYKKDKVIIFIKGNHDQFYFDLQGGVDKSNYRLSKIVKESVNWTMKKIHPVLLESAFKWRESYCIGNTYFAHANPFEYGNWSYLEESEDLSKAFQSLYKKQFFSGLFGHSHRQLFVGKEKDNMLQIDDYQCDDNKLDHLIINTGSIGQPRGKGAGYIVLEMKDNSLNKAEFQKITINFDNSIDLINQANFSQETNDKLINYLKV